MGLKSGTWWVTFLCVYAHDAHDTGHNIQSLHYSNCQLSAL